MRSSVFRAGLFTITCNKYIYSHPLYPFVFHLSLLNILSKVEVFLCVSFRFSFCFILLFLALFTRCIYLEMSVFYHYYIIILVKSSTISFILLTTKTSTPHFIAKRYKKSWWRRREPYRRDMASISTFVLTGN